VGCWASSHPWFIAGESRLQRSCLFERVTALERGVVDSINVRVSILRIIHRSDVQTFRRSDVQIAGYRLLTSKWFILSVVMCCLSCSSSSDVDGAQDGIAGIDGGDVSSNDLDASGLETDSADVGADSTSSHEDAPDDASGDVFGGGSEDGSGAPDIQIEPDAGAGTSDANSLPTNTWTALQSFPGSGRRHALSFVLDSKIFVGGGRGFHPASGWSELKDLWAYDTQDATWSPRGDLPASAQSGHIGWLSSRASALVVGGSVMVQRLSQTWSYDSGEDLWTQSATFPGETDIGPIAFTDGDQLYAGLGGHKEMQQVGGFNLLVAVPDLKVYRLDSTTQSWSFYKAFPLLQSVVLTAHLVSQGATAFVLKGNSSQGWPVYILDHGSMTLTAQANLPFSGDEHPSCAVEVGGHLVIVGVDTPETYLDLATHEERVWALDEELNQWGVLFEGPLETLHGDLQGPACAGIGDTLYTGLGMTTPQAPPTAPQGTSVSHLAAGHLISIAAFNGSALSPWGWRSQSPFEPLSIDEEPVRDIDASDLAAAVVDGQGKMHAVGECVSGGQTSPPPHLEGDFQRVEVACYASLGLTVSGDLVGANTLGSFENLELPQEAKSNGISEISLGGSGAYGLVLDGSGRVHTVGTPWDVEPLPPEVEQDIVEIAAGYSHALALTSWGAVIAWGNDGLGAASVPPDLPSPTVAIDAGEDLSAAVSADGVLTCWGWLCESYIEVPDEIQGHVRRARLGAEHIVVELDDGTLRDLGNVRGTGANFEFFARAL
jgi:hypothetical protein